MKQTELNKEGFNEGLRSRLTELVKEHSQAEIARKTEVLRSSFSRYLKGMKIPAEFCHALVHSLGVNPSWLLTGEGTRYLSDISVDTEMQASDMLELVRGMNTALEMRIGALAGKKHLKALRELSSELEIYQRLREKLNEQIRPTFKKLINELYQSLHKSKFERAREIRKALVQASKLCDDQTLAVDYHSAMAEYDYLLQDDKGHIEHAKQAYYSMLSGTGSITPKSLTLATQLALSLSTMGLNIESQRIARSALIMGEELLDTNEGRTLSYFGKYLDVVDGDINRAMDGLRKCFDRLPEPMKSRNRLVLAVALLLGGYISVEDIAAANSSSSTLGDPAHAIRLPFNMRQKEAFATIYERYLADPGDSAYTDPYNVIKAKYYLEAIRSGSKTIIAKFEKDPEVRTAMDSYDKHDQFMYAVFLCTVAVIVGNKKKAAQLFEKTDKLMNSVPQEVSLLLTDRAEHYINALELTPEKGGTKAQTMLRARAKAFFKNYYERGCNIFRPWVEPDSE